MGRWTWWCSTDGTVQKLLGFGCLSTQWQCRPSSSGTTPTTSDRVTATPSLRWLSFSEGKALLTEKQKLSLLTLHEREGMGEFMLAFYRVERVPVMKWGFDLVLKGFCFLAGRSKQMHKILVISLGKKPDICSATATWGTEGVEASGTRLKACSLRMEPAFSTTKEK